MSSSDLTSELPKLRKANDWIDLETLKSPEELFGDFWREGELAILFGPTGVGKSLLAVQIADALARGRPIEGLNMSARRRNVLYVDLVLSDEQWAMRYSRDGRGGRRRGYKFSTGLFRDRPTDGRPIADWLRAILTAEKISVVVIDDLSVISRSNDGTRETLELICELRQITREMGVSVLVLADSYPFVFERRVAERDLRSNRVLCAFADSVFAIEARSGGDRRELIQTRAQAGAPVWTHRSPVRLILTTLADGCVGFECEEMAPAERDLILKIKQMHDNGRSFRMIADELDMSKSAACRLHAKWRPNLDLCTEEDEDDEFEEEDEFPEKYPGEHTDNYLVSHGMGMVWKDKHEDELAAPGTTADLAVMDAVNADASRSGGREVNQLKHSFDAYGNQIFIEKEDDRGRPVIWYRYDKKGNKYRRERTATGIFSEINLPP